MIKIQSYVSVQVRSFLSDVDGLKDFSRQVLRLLFKNLDVIPVYLVGVVAPCHMFINCRPGSCCFEFCVQGVSFVSSNFLPVSPK